MARNKIELEIRGDDRLTPVMKGVQRSVDTTTGSLIKNGEKATSTWAKFTKQMLSFKTVMIGVAAVVAGAYGLKRLASYGIEVASSFEQMELKLEALTKGKGVETLERINQWALDMPVNTEKAVTAFTSMMARGLNPTLEKMQILVDTSIIFGEQALPRVSKALGDMATLAKLSQRELDQLSEVGINARKYLTEAFGMTVTELQKANVEIEKIIDVIWKGLAEDFGGAAIKAQNTWQGLTATFTSYVVEITRAAMAGGAFDLLKDALRSINKELKDWLANNELLFAQKLPAFFDDLKKAASMAAAGVSILVEVMRYLPGTAGAMAAWDLYNKMLEDRPHIVRKPMPKMPKMEIKGPGMVPVAEDKISKQILAAYNKSIRDSLAQALDDQDKYTKEGLEYYTKYYQDMEKLAWDAYQSEGAAAAEMWEKGVKAAEAAEKDIFSITEQLKYSIEDNFINALDGVIDKTMSVGEAFRDMVGSILRDLGRMMIRKGLSSLLDTVFEAMPFHGGGTVGQPGGMVRQVSPLAFVGAPRLHTELKHDEVPAILQRGEEVTAAGESRAKVVVDIHDNTFMDDQRLMSLIQSVSAMTTAEILPGLMLANVKDDGDMRTMIANVGRGM